MPSSDHIHPAAIKLRLEQALASTALVITSVMTIGAAHATTETMATTGAVAEQATPNAVSYKKMAINGVEIAYREAGNPERPTILLLHGFPSSSHMYRDLIPQLAKQYHVLAPDYPGYGDSEMPRREEFEYSFANFANIVDEFVVEKGVGSYAVYVMDYGAPVGYRLFAKHPERVTGFIIQNGNAYEEGLSAFWDPIKAYWADGSQKNRDALRGALTLETTKWQYLNGVTDATKISPDAWRYDQSLLDRDGNDEIQLDMFASYATNVAEYPKWQKLFREYQPPAIIMWGKNDEIFPADGAYPYKRDLKNVEFHLLETGHFALEEYGDWIATKILGFMDREVAKK